MDAATTIKAAGIISMRMFKRSESSTESGLKGGGVRKGIKGIAGPMGVGLGVVGVGVGLVGVGVGVVGVGVAVVGPVVSMDCIDGGKDPASNFSGGENVAYEPPILVI